MDPQFHTMTLLFEQLGLPDDADQINEFLRNHTLPEGEPLYSAPFWSPAQAQFLKEAIADDSDWCEIVDHLDTSLRIH